MKVLSASMPPGATDARRVKAWLREQVMALWGAEDANFTGAADSTATLKVYLLNDGDPHTEQDLAALCATFPPGWRPQSQIDQERGEIAEGVVMPHLLALKNLSPVDQVYALMGRMMAINDGATQVQVNAIVNRATAGAYVMAKPEWAALNAAQRQWAIDELDMIASVLQIIIVKLG